MHTFLGHQLWATAAVQVKLVLTCAFLVAAKKCLSAELRVCSCCSQILIRWAIQNGTSVIPKATGVSHIQGNLDALNFELTPEEFQVSRPHRLVATLMYFLDLLLVL